MSSPPDHEDGPPNARSRESRPGAPAPNQGEPRDPCHGGTTIQKVEIVITTDQSPSKIARAIEQRLREIGEQRAGDEKSDAAPADDSRRLRLQTRYEALRAYLQTAFAERDWHAVSDAANDLRCVETELRCLGAKP